MGLNINKKYDKAYKYYNDPITGDLYDEWYQIDSTLISEHLSLDEQRVAT